MSLVSAAESAVNALCCAKALMIELEVVSSDALSVATETYTMARACSDTGLLGHYSESATVSRATRVQRGETGNVLPHFFLPAC